jgi:RNA polymerase sigma-70 factor (ECF subfamily)
MDIDKGSEIARGRFQTTHWSLIQRAGGCAQDAANALEELCRGYWPPVYVFVRRRGFDVHTAQDLTQEFVTRLLDDGSLFRADPARGRFRSYLLGALEHFLANERQRSRAWKRGGRTLVFSFEDAEEDGREALAPVDSDSPEKVFERRWVETVIARVSARIRREYEAAGQEARFEALKVHLPDVHGPVSYTETAARLNLTVSAVKSAIHRLRRRYGELFRAEVAQTVASAGDVEEEIRWMLSALGD